MTKNLSIFLLAVLVVLETNFVEVSSAPFDIKDLFPDVLKGLSQTQQTTFLGVECNYSVTPTFRDWELHFAGKFWCPSLSPPVSGNSLRRSTDGAIESATRDFARKALKAKIFTAEQLKGWL